MTRITQKVVFEGHVQGVGFRYCAKEVAKGYEITGTIKNLPSGIVEMIVTGLEAEIQEFITSIQESEIAKHIKQTQISLHPLIEQSDFRIIS